MVTNTPKEQDYKFGEIPDTVWATESARIYSDLELDKPYEYPEYDSETAALLIEPNF
ncbi:Hypothetical protein Bdt_1097 [Bdellovibrio bacteriovorus str. Tiberius]|uniref:Uncharacterized protein n=2 Tax=Bdellovibrio bacteriovorus TaxID=959 RepID=K7ZES9_BDEBC|nr:Hypothetical protein Bdt_1097 [Bdellovibrio bacteriovorus str. Tiberius]